MEREKFSILMVKQKNVYKNKFNNKNINNNNNKNDNNNYNNNNNYYYYLIKRLLEG